MIIKKYYKLPIKENKMKLHQLLNIEPGYLNLSSCLKETVSKKSTLNKESYLIFIMFPLKIVPLQNFV